MIVSESEDHESSRFVKIKASLMESQWDEAHALNAQFDAEAGLANAKADARAQSETFSELYNNAYSSLLDAANSGDLRGQELVDAYHWLISNHGTEADRQSLEDIQRFLDEIETGAPLLTSSQYSVEHKVITVPESTVDTPAVTIMLGSLSQKGLRLFVRQDKGHKFEWNELEPSKVIVGKSAIEEYIVHARENTRMSFWASVDLVKIAQSVDSESLPELIRTTAKTAQAILFSYDPDDVEYRMALRFLHTHAIEEIDKHFDSLALMYVRRGGLLNISQRLLSEVKRYVQLKNRASVESEIPREFTDDDPEILRTFHALSVRGHELILHEESR